MFPDFQPLFSPPAEPKLTLEDHVINTPTAIGKALGLPPFVAIVLLSRKQW